MGLSTAAVGVIKNEDNVLIGSGVAIDSGSSMSSCGKCVSIKIISWKECDTLSKIIGFISGRIIKFISNIASKSYRFIARITCTNWWQASSDRSSFCRANQICFELNFSY